jgi:hypothetical protein
LPPFLGLVGEERVTFVGRLTELAHGLTVLAVRPVTHTTITVLTRKVIAHQLITTAQVALKRAEKKTHTHHGE